MKFVMIFGPQAVGKMTVGQELSKITGLKLFHNHMTIDLVSNFFSYSSPTGKMLVNKFREDIFKAVAVSDLKGLIFTYVWAFDEAKDWEYVDYYRSIFESHGAEVYFVELEASLEERLKRNVHPERLKLKPTKRDTKFSEKDLMETLNKHRVNSYKGEIKQPNYIRIDNTSLEPENVARMIKERFKL